MLACEEEVGGGARMCNWSYSQPPMDVTVAVVVGEEGDRQRGTQVWGTQVWHANVGMQVRARFRHKFWRDPNPNVNSRFRHEFKVQA
eukprot:353194-Chlamydomonas_euryale.AAC.1